MTLFTGEEALDKAMRRFLLARPRHAAPVSDAIPLISNQEAWLNIALIKQYHENMPVEESRKMVLGLLRDLGLEKIAEKRNPALAEEERFYVMLLRAAMVERAAIVIDRPFAMMPHLKNFHSVMMALKTIDGLYASCDIYDYDWMKDKYGALCQ